MYESASLTIWKHHATTITIKWHKTKKMYYTPIEIYDKDRFIVSLTSLFTFKMRYWLPYGSTQCSRSLSLTHTRVRARQAESGYPTEMYSLFLCFVLLFAVFSFFKFNFCSAIRLLGPLLFLFLHFGRPHVACVCVRFYPYLNQPHIGSCSKEGIHDTDSNGGNDDDAN